MAAAKTKQQYIDAWTDHVNQLIHPALDAEMPPKDFAKMKAEIIAMVERAAAKVFEDSKAA